MRRLERVRSRCHVERRESNDIPGVAVFPFVARLRQLVESAGAQLCSETDEQGLQVALVTSEKHRVVSVNEVSICGYYRLPSAGGWIMRPMSVST